MTALGSVLEPEGGGGPKGPDLFYVAQVPPKALGDTAGYAVAVPQALDHEGQKVPRAASPHDEGGKIRLHLPAQVPEGAVLRLRGQGGVVAGGGAPGDLLLQIEVVAPAVTFGVVLLWLLALAAGAVVAALYVKV